MASEKLVLFFLFFLASWASTILSQDDPGVKPCIAKLMPCVDFLHSDKRPSSVCCMALKGELENDVECLCKLFNDGKALKAFNVTRSEVIRFPTRCGLQPADVSKCKKSGGKLTLAFLFTFFFFFNGWILFSSNLNFLFVYIAWAILMKYFEKYFYIFKFRYFSFTWDDV